VAVVGAKATVLALWGVGGSRFAATDTAVAAAEVLPRVRWPTGSCPAGRKMGSGGCRGCSREPRGLPLAPPVRVRVWCWFGVAAW